MSIPFDLWGQRGYAAVDVAGESHYASAIRGLFGRDFKADGTEITVTAALVPEPGNNHDRNAVGVWAAKSQLGYLTREDAARFVSVLSTLVADGWLPQVQARVWAAEWSEYGDNRTVFRGSVRLDLAEPHLLVPANLPPRARSSREIVEVRIDDDAVGQLSPRMSSELLPAIRHVAQRGMVPTARAIVKGNRIKAEVVLHVARAHELPEAWLDDVRSSSDRGRAPVVQIAEAVDLPTQTAHAPIPPHPTGFSFVVPPEWPQPPPGWSPAPGWKPDPRWPAAPDNWQWWVPVWQ